MRAMEFRKTLFEMATLKMFYAQFDLACLLLPAGNNKKI
jgi:hypothetical protein